MHSHPHTHGCGAWSLVCRAHQPHRRRKGRSPRCCLACKCIKVSSASRATCTPALGNRQSTMATKQHGWQLRHLADSPPLQKPNSRLWPNGKRQGWSRSFVSPPWRWLLRLCPPLKKTVRWSACGAHDLRLEQRSLRQLQIRRRQQATSARCALTCRTPQTVHERARLTAPPASLQIAADAQSTFLPRALGRRLRMECHSTYSSAWLV